MMRLLQSLKRRRPISDESHAEEALDFLRAPLAAMAPLHPPTAKNDDPLQVVYAEVERELRVAGYLR